jgi:nucleotide-binding universal stress UspA family protein
MFYRILVPLDGSLRAEAAIPVAARLARASHGTVILVRSVELPPVISPLGAPPAPVMTPEPFNGSERADEAARYLERLASQKPLAGLKTLTQVAEGPAVDSILALSQQERADLIVMCARGMRAYHRWKLGSVTQHVAHHAQAPVLVLNELTTGAPERQFATVRRALVPLDGSALAEAAIPAAIQLMAAQAPDNGSLHLLRVVSPFAGEERGATQESVVAEANAYLQRLTERLTATPTEHLRLSVTAGTVVDADAASAILAAAEPAGEPSGEAGERSTIGRDMIVMATHGRTGILRWSLGSITERVLQATELPLLIVRPVPGQPAKQS